MSASFPTLSLETAPTATEPPKCNDNSNPQQGTGGARSTPKSPEGAPQPQASSGPYSRPSLLVPPTKKDERKLFVGGLPSDVTNEEFHSFFEQFGPVLDSIVLVDRNTNRSRGFGFVTFENAETSRKVLSFGSTDGSTTQQYPAARLEMRGKLIEVKLAVPKESTRRVARPHRMNHAAYDMPGVAPYPFPMYGDQSANGVQYPPLNDGYVAPPPYYPAPGAVFGGYMAPVYYRPDMVESSYSMEGPSPSAYAFFPSPPPQFGFAPHQQGQAFSSQQHYIATQPPPQTFPRDNMEGEAH